MACRAYTKSYVFPTTDKINTYLRALVSACPGVLLNPHIRYRERVDPGNDGGSESLLRYKIIQIIQIIHKMHATIGTPVAFLRPRTSGALYMLLYDACYDTSSVSSRFWLFFFLDDEGFLNPDLWFERTSFRYVLR